MSVFTTVTRRPITVLIIFVVLLIFSIVMSMSIPIDFQPNVEFNEVTVTTTYIGANAELVEDTITVPLERVINSIDNIDEITSRTIEGSSMISITFKYKSGMEKNIDNLRNAIDMVSSQLPDDAGKPNIFRFGATGDPVIVMSISANRNHNELREYVDDVLTPYLEQINGVAFVAINGGVKKSVYIDISLNRLNAYNLTLGEIQNIIQSNGYGSTLGTIETKYKNVGVILDGEYKNIEAIKNIIVSERKINNDQSAFVRLRDIAEVNFDYGSEARQFYLNDSPGIVVWFFKQNDANIVEVSNNIRDEIKRLEAITPDDFSFGVLSDFTSFIRAILNAVSDTALYGGMLALLVLIFFLRNITSVLCIACSIPISIVLTIMFMNMYGITLNFMTLTGLTMGIGIIVDNSIVVLENIYMKRKKKINLLPAAEYGVAEMAVPVFASTATTVLVFLPMLIFEQELGVIGAYFTNLGFAVVVSVIISYFTAIFLVPVLTSKFIPLHVNRGRGVIGKIKGIFDTLFQFIERSYEAVLTYTIHRRKRFIVLIILLAFFPFLLLPRLGYSFIPDFTQDAVSVFMRFPPGSTNEEMYRTAKEYEEKIQPFLPEVANRSLEIIGSGTSISFFDSGLYTVELIVFFKDYMHNDDFKPLLDELNTIAKEYPFRISARSFYGGGGPGGGDANFTLKVRADDMNKLKQASESFSDSLRSIPDFLDVSSNLPSSNLAISLAVNRERANAYGLSVRGVSDELGLAVSRKTVGTYVQGSKEYNITMRLRDEDSKRVDLFDQLYIKTPTSRLPLSNLIERSLSTAEQRILREDSIKTIQIEAQLAEGYTIDKAIADARRALSENPLSLDEDITYFFSGEFEDRNKNYRIMGLIFLFAILFVFGVMASQFESFSDPFIIIFTIPLTFSGVLLIYWLTGNSLSSFSLAGLVILVGISVNHGIVLVDYINVLRRRNYGLVRSIAEGARNRLQPILMTTFTTMGGMAPLAFTTKAGAELVQPLALTLFGGLGTSAFLSLFFIPLIYGGFHSLKNKFGRKRRARALQRRHEHEEEILRISEMRK